MKLKTIQCFRQINWIHWLADILRAICLIKTLWNFGINCGRNSEQVNERVVIDYPTKIYLQVVVTTYIKL